MIDLTFLKNFTGNNPEKMKKYIQMFVSTAPNMIEKMEHAMKSSDFETIKITAHSLKPQLGYMGISSLESVAKNIEHYAGDQVNLEQLPALINQFKTDISAAIELLNSEMNQL